MTTDTDFFGSDQEAEVDLEALFADLFGPQDEGQQKAVALVNAIRDDLPLDVVKLRLDDETEVSTLVVVDFADQDSQGRVNSIPVAIILTDDLAQRLTVAEDDQELTVRD